jgi:hypothetical protein
MPNRVAAIESFCRACIYDPGSPGGWREQVAACASANCPLFEIRPVPHHCVRRGVINREAVYLVRTKLETTQRRPG